MHSHFGMRGDRKAVADLRGAQGMRTPWGPNSLNFMQFWGKFGKIVYWCPPPQGNPGSATGKVYDTDGQIF